MCVLRARNVKSVWKIYDIILPEIVVQMELSSLRVDAGQNVAQSTSLFSVYASLMYASIRTTYCQPANVSARVVTKQEYKTYFIR